MGKWETKKLKTYAVYKGDEFKFMGTISECSKYLGVDERTVYFYTTPSYKKRSEDSKHYHHLVVIRVEDD